MAASNAFRYTLAIDQGATFSKVFTWKTGTPYLPVDLTGCTALMQIRATLDDPVVLLLLSTANARIALGGVAGTITLTVSAADTTLITWLTAVYDLQIVLANGTIRRLLGGNVTVSPEVTR